MLQGCRKDEEWDAQRVNTSALALSDDLASPSSALVSAVGGSLLP